MLMAMCGNNFVLTILMLVELIVLLDVQLLLSAAIINSERKDSPETHTGIRKSTLKLHDANGEWGIMLYESPQLGDLNESADDFDINEKSTLKQSNEFTKTLYYNEEDTSNNLAGRKIKSPNSKENNKNHQKPNGNKGEVSRVKRSTRRRGSRRHLSRRSGLLRPPTPPPDLPPPPWQVNQGICPPILCGTPAGIQQPPANSPGTGSQSEPTSTDDVIVPIEAIRVRGNPIASHPGRTFSFFEGDIVLDVDMRRRIDRQRRNRRHNRFRRAVVRPVTRLWRYGEVPYLIDQRIGGKVRRLIQEAMQHYEEETCIRFIPRTNQKDYIVYVYQPGCWSSVGKVGGEQFISLGYGCDYLGTVVHETGHALGFWHEQSRADRDQYVKIVKKNISPRGRDQFDKRSVDEHTSRGYAYDYESIMHYGDKYFSKNNQPTMKLKGPGKKLHFKIGQRNELSHLDIAQIRDVYYCNKKEAEGKACSSGWIRFKRSCYKYVNEPEQFDGAKSRCLRMGARLVHIESKAEDDFIRDYTLKHKKSERTWRTGGRKVNYRWWWYGKSGSTGHPPFNYTAWAPGHPWYYDSLALVRYDGSPRNYIWRGIYATSSTPSRNAYPFICEMKANVTKIISKTKGRNYQGRINYTA